MIADFDVSIVIDKKLMLEARKSNKPFIIIIGYILLGILELQTRISKP